MKKVFVCLSTLLLFFTVFICMTLPASAETVGGNCGPDGYYFDSVKWSLDTDTGKLTISGSGEMGGTIGGLLRGMIIDHQLHLLKFKKALQV